MPGSGPTLMLPGHRLRRPRREPLVLASESHHRGEAKTQPIGGFGAHRNMPQLPMETHPSMMPPPRAGGRGVRRWMRAAKARAMRFPNHLSEPKPQRMVLTGSGARLVLLLAMCLAPRMWMAQRIDGVCPDGAFHLGKAQQVEQNTTRAPRDGYDFNVYPLIISAWHRTGLEWETAAKVWGVLSGSLVVLPLFGWLRRMFDDRVAFLSCALYAVQPKLVEWSPEALRDPTFWLLFTSSLYFTWRAVTEVRLGWFVLAGGATFLAANTRFEGWLLVLPLAGWAACRWLALRQARGRLVGGAALFALCYPLVVATLVYCHGFERWDWGSFHRLQLVTNWAQAHWNSLVSPAATQAQGEAAEITSEPPTAEQAPVASTKPDDAPQPTLMAAQAAVSVPPSEDPAADALPPIKPRTAGRVAWIMAEKIGRAFTATFGVLALIGLARWWRLCFRWDRLPLVILCLGTLSAVWIFTAEHFLSSTRYILPLVILSTPIAALGLLPLCRWASRAAAWAAPGVRAAPHLAATTVFVLALAGGCADALSSRLSSRAMKAELGDWVRQQLGEQTMIVASANWSLSTYHAAARFQRLPYPDFTMTPARFGQMIDDTQPDVVLLCRQSVPGPTIRLLADQAARRKLEPVDPDQLPTSCRGHVTVFIRRPGVHMAARPSL